MTFLEENVKAEYLKELGLYFMIVFGSKQPDWLHVGLQPSPLQVVITIMH